MNFFYKFFDKRKSSFEDNNLIISSSLKDFVRDEVLPGLDFTENFFWSSFEKVINKFSIRNKELLTKRRNIQEQINDWHIKNRSLDFNIEKYKNFLIDIGYISPRSNDFKIKTWNFDTEIRKIAGPQLVVPVMNARFALNAANARWGSLYDALYGTDIINDEDGAHREGGYNPARGEKVIAFAKKFLDETIPLEKGSYSEVLKFQFIDSELLMTLKDGSKINLQNKDQYIGYKDDGEGAYGLLFKNNNLHFEIQIDRSHPIGQEDLAGIKDILMESAITTIQDCEDSVPQLMQRTK